MSRINILSVMTVFIFAQIVGAQGIDLTVDQSQSLATISVLGGSDDSSITGNAVIELDPTSEPFSTARLTELNLTMADGFSISLLGGAAVVGVDPNGASVFFIQVGVAGTVDGMNQFDQTGNLFGVTGMSMIDSIFGDEVIDLSTVKPVAFDIIDAQIDVKGNDLTVTAMVDLDFDFEVIGSVATMNLSGPIVLNGVLPDDVLLGDVNCDGEINLLDVGPFVDLITAGEFDVKADINEDGAVDLLDVQPFIMLLTGG